MAKPGETALPCRQSWLLTPVTEKREERLITVHYWKCENDGEECGMGREGERGGGPPPPPPPPGSRNSNQARKLFRESSSREAV
eukprot:5925490-Pyramimonas_sp.AAC.1